MIAPSQLPIIRTGDSIMGTLAGFRVAILAADGFEESELIEPLHALENADAEVTIVSLSEGQIQGVKHNEKGERVKVDRTLQDVWVDEFDGVMLPGGALNADTLRTVPEVRAFLQAIQNAGKPIAAICHAPWELISAGIVRGRTLTSYSTIQDDIVNAGGAWVDREVVEDRNWVTSRQPADLPAFNAAMIRLFARSESQMQQA
jgi:protease I